MAAAAYPDRVFDSYRFILGTGLTRYIEENAGIEKASGWTDMAIQSLIPIRSYDKAPGELLTYTLTARPMIPNPAVRKMISGAYQGSLIPKSSAGPCLRTCSRRIRNGLKKVDVLSSRDIDEFCYYPYSSKYTLSCTVTLTAK